MPAQRTANQMARPLVVAALVALSSGPLYRVRTWWSYDDPLAEDALIVALHAAFGAIAVAGLASAGRWRRLDVRASTVAGAFVAWITLGAVWSLDPDGTLRQGLQLASSLAVGAAGAAVLGAVRFRLALWMALHVGLGWSFVAIYLDRAGTIDDGDWTGVFFNRNSLALYAALGLLVSGFVVVDALAAPRRWSSLVLVAAVAAAVLVDVRLIAGSDAATPLGALAAAALAAIASVIGRRLVSGGHSAGRVVAGAGIVAGAAATLAWLTRGAWLGWLGRDADLTGRSELWGVALDWAWRRPLVGFGYLGPWSDAEFLADIERQRGRLLGSAHNSFIEVLLGAGIVGLALFVALLVVLYLRHGRAAVTARTSSAAFPLAVIVFVVVENLTETLFVGNQLVVALVGALLVTATRRTPRTTDR